MAPIPGAWPEDPWHVRRRPGGGLVLLQVLIQLAGVLVERVEQPVRTVLARQRGTRRDLAQRVVNGRGLRQSVEKDTRSLL